MHLSSSGSAGPLASLSAPLVVAVGVPFELIILWLPRSPSLDESVVASFGPISICGSWALSLALGLLRLVLLLTL